MPVTSKIPTSLSISLAACVAAAGSALAAGSLQACADADPGDCHALNTCNGLADASMGDATPGDDGGPGDGSTADHTVADTGPGDSTTGDAPDGGDGSPGDSPSDTSSDHIVPNEAGMCEGGLTNCSGTCVNLDKDPQHCGKCSTACPGPEAGAGMATCSGSPAACGIGCSSGFHLCNVDQCLPDKDPPSGDPCVLTDAFGVFVDKATGANDSSHGTSAAPYASIGYALQNTKGLGRVYVCNGNYQESLGITAPVAMYGGLTCAGHMWKYAAGTTADVAPTAPGYALSVVGVTGSVVVQDMTFTAMGASGTDGAGNGSSSIAGWVQGSSDVGFTRVGFTAHDGAPGVNGGGPTSNWFGGTLTGNSASGQNAAPANVCACPDGTTTSTGASGGAGAPTPTAGGAGDSSPKAMAVAGGYDGKGGGKGGGFCGSSAHSGAPGAGGKAGGNATDLGTLGGSGWKPGPGSAGTIGDPGQGGGGGGGDNNSGGGGGGCGGCGGGAGPAGSAGGSSFALAAVGSTVSLTSCSLHAGNGLVGGAGGTGQDGQVGGFGAGGGPSCLAAQGGPGGGGGGGGGGAGGNSFGVAWTGSGTLTVDGSKITGSMVSLTNFNTGNAGVGGTNAPGGAGAIEGLEPTNPGLPDPTGFVPSYAPDGGVMAVQFF